MKNNESPDRMKLTGVYCILNLVNGKRYVGSAANSFKKRKSEHTNALKRGKHHSVSLQRSWDKHGGAAFEFRIEEITLPEHAVACEQSFIDFRKSADSDFGYNICTQAGSTRGTKRSEKSRKKMSEMQVGRIATDAAKNNMSIAGKGRVFSDEHRKNISLSGKGRVFSDEHRRKNSESHKNPSPETRFKIGSANRGRVFSDEALAKMAASAKIRNAKPEYRERMSLALKGRIFSDEHNSNLAEANRNPVKIAKCKATALRNKLAKASAMLSIVGVDL